MKQIDLDQFRQWLQEQPRSRIYNTTTSRYASCPLAVYLTETTGIQYWVGQNRYGNAEEGAQDLPLAAKRFICELDTRYKILKPTTLAVETLLEEILSASAEASIKW